MPATPEQPHPLDVPQDYTEATSYEVRDELQKMIERDLLGPWDGEDEEFRPNADPPGGRYLVGRLGPRRLDRASREPVEEIAATADENPADGRSGELTDRPTMQDAGKMWASSMGLSFQVARTVTSVHVTARWGEYRKVSSQDKDGKPREVWKREQINCPVDVDLTVKDQRIQLKRGYERTDVDSPGVLLDVAVRDHDGRQVVELSLINTQDEPPNNRDVACLFQAELLVTARGGTDDVFLPIDDPEDDDVDRPSIQDTEDEHLRLLYRGERRYARGRNIAVAVAVDDLGRNAYVLKTSWLPTYDIPATIAPTVADTPSLQGLELSMDALAKANPTGLHEMLSPLATGYAAWLDEREANIPKLPASLRAVADRAVRDARRAATRIRDGIRLLTEVTEGRHHEALESFRFANKAMADQRRHTQVAAIREARGSSYVDALAEVEARGAKAASWRPFQLAFILLNLPAITDPAHPERAADADAVVDLLFFPTGGGKTEAYLGLAAYTFAIRRLQGDVGEGAERRDGRAGVTVLMRYTLRLLTAQQFQRAAALVCAAEMLRREDQDRFGDEPFRIGLWVGMGVSPNSYVDAAREINDARTAGRGRQVKVLQTLSCPWCGEQLAAERDLFTSDDERRVRLICPNGEGPNACPFSHRPSGGEGLPILTVDEEIYRYLPSLLIATVDKFAQLPWQGFAGMLFGRVRTRCPRHGYQHPDLGDKTGCAAKHNARGSLPATVAQSVAPLRPPDLIIQDEMHLISGALGTTVGLFESAVDELSTWYVDGHAVGPKIIASTATTKRAKAQVRGVFGRDLEVFPPPVIDVSDTFFSRQVPISPKSPGRRYLGLCAHGSRLKQVEIRLAETLSLAGQTLFDRYGAVADPYMTTVGYFNATRELAGMRRYLDDDVTTRVRRHKDRPDWSQRLLGKEMLTIAELTSRINSAEISAVLGRLEAPFEPELDTTARRSAIFGELAGARKEKREPHGLARRFEERQQSDRSPIANALATSMLQVGVDVSRFGLMVVTGQPKNTAEYIQASSRVGRQADRPGLVVTLYHWSRPRDLAHFEDFTHYHATFYREVEALSVTPYTRRSIDRTAAGTFVAAVRNRTEADSLNAAAYDVDLDSPEIAALIERMLRRAENVAGQRGRGYLAERVETIQNRWKLAKAESRQGGVRLGYTDKAARDNRLNALLRQADGTPWADLTVGYSMRETENEINLLVTGGDVREAIIGASEWVFQQQPDEDAETEGTEEEER